MSSHQFEKFTERARRVLTLAQEEAQRFNHNYIGTEHLLLGLVREGDGIAARVLNNLGVQLPRIRSQLEFIIGRGETMIMGEIGLTPRAKKVIELAVDEARRLNHNYIGTEHILLGLIREGNGLAAGVLESLGVRLEEARAQVLQVISSGGQRAPVSWTERVPSPQQGRRLSDEEQAIMIEPLGELLRVVPVNLKQERPNATLLVIAVECYDNGFVVTFRLNGSAIGDLLDFVVEAVDDQQQRYRGVMHGGSGGGSPARREMRFAVRFGPVLASTAHSLDLTLAERNTPRPRREHPEPWHCAIPLSGERAA